MDRGFDIGGSFLKPRPTRSAVVAHPSEGLKPNDYKRYLLSNIFCLMCNIRLIFSSSKWFLRVRDKSCSEVTRHVVHTDANRSGGGSADLTERSDPSTPSNDIQIETNKISTPCYAMRCPGSSQM